MSSRGMRDDIYDALKGFDEGDDSQDNESSPGVAPGEQTDVAESAEAETAAATDVEEKGGSEADEQLSSAEVADSETPTQSEKAPDTSNDSIKAPVDWSPKEREQWSKIPRPLQERIVAREKAMAGQMADTKSAREVHQAFTGVANQFGSVLAADGYKNPIEAAQAAFGTMAALRMGTQQQKAEQIARLITQYGVDIETLDGTLSGAPVQQRQNPDIDRVLQERLAPMQQFMQQFQSQQQMQQQQVKQQADQQVQQFAEKAEFLNDVREDMADIITTAGKRGVNLSLQQAYDRACAAHPEISQVIEERRRNQALISGQQSLQSKRTASSSLSGVRGGDNAAGGSGSLRDSIAAAWDQAADG